jgi:hypothetical protein
MGPEANQPLVQWVAHGLALYLMLPSSGCIGMLWTNFYLCHCIIYQRVLCGLKWVMLIVKAIFLLGINYFGG